MVIKAFRIALLALCTILALLVLSLIGFRIAAEIRETQPFGQALPEDGRLQPTDDGTFFLLEAGQPGDPPVLFAHGTAAWSGLWHPTLKVVAGAGFHAAGFDMPPFGWSEHPDDTDFSRTRQAERIVALLEALDTKPIIVAHSIGAGPMAEAVLQRPDLVSGFVIVAGAIALGSHEAPKAVPLPLRSEMVRIYATAATASNPWLTGPFLRGFIHVKEAATPDRIALLREPLQRDGYTKALSHWIPTLLATPVDAISTRAETWQALDLPVVLIWGSEDTVTPPEQAETLRDLIPGAELVMLNDVGHIPQIEAPAVFEGALLQALRGMSP